MAMQRTDRTGGICVGGVRLAPLDVGFDIRLHDILVVLPDDMTGLSVGYEADGKVWEATGTDAELRAALAAAGYQVAKAQSTGADNGQ
jgi:hypothetical protein